MLEILLGLRSGYQVIFDSINQDLLMRAVRRHTQETWVLLYIERWLKAPVQLKNGEIEPRDCVTPQDR